MAAQKIQQANIFGRIGTGFGRGLAEQIPKEVERNRLSSGLEELGKQQGLTPFQQYTGLVRAAHEYPAVVQGGADLLRQQAIIDSIDKNRPTRYEPNKPTGQPSPEASPKFPSPTTTESTRARLNPYIPPKAEEREDMALDLYRDEPLKYPTLDEARSKVDRDVNADLQRSGEEIKKGELERNVGEIGAQKVRNQIAQSGADIPPTLLTKLQNEAVGEITSGRLSEDEAMKDAAKRATEISKNFSNLHALGGLGAAVNNKQSIFNALKNFQQEAKKEGYQQQGADQLVTELNVTPQYAYAQMYPVKDNAKLNDLIKSLPDIKSRTMTRPLIMGTVNELPGYAEKETKKILNQLSEAMGFHGSPLSIAHELEKKGYDSETWKEHLLKNKQDLNLTQDQIYELGKTKPGFWGKLYDLWFGSFSGVE